MGYIDPLGRFIRDPDVDSVFIKSKNIFQTITIPNTISS